MNNVIAAIVGLASVLLVGSVVWFPLQTGDVPSPGKACLSNVKQQALGLIQYTSDNDDRLPPDRAWMDGIAPYVRDERVFHDPELSEQAYGYAFDQTLSHAKTTAKPETVPMVYDSTDLHHNASDRVTSLPSPGRHKGRNSIGYADGHVKRVAP